MRESPSIPGAAPRGSFLGLLGRLTVPSLTLLSLCSAGCGGSADPSTSPDAPPTLPISGSWRASLASDGGPLTFGLDFVESEGGLQAVLVNGVERRPAGFARVTPDGITFEIPPYRSTIVAKLEDDGRSLVGWWYRDRGAGHQPVLPFAAVHGLPAALTGTLSDASIAAIDGTWSVAFASDDDAAVGTFAIEPNGRASGTFQTTLGDYRYLSGWFDGASLRLTCFDGAHAFLFDAALQEDGSLKGDFWSRDAYHDTWTAVKDPNADLPDDFALTSWVGGIPLSEIQFEDLDGKQRALDDPAFASTARLLVLFGTWCPNCNDLTEYLVELDEEYEGLSIVGLAFEFGDDTETHRRVVRDYLDHHSAHYPVLLAGTSDKAKASAVFPLLDRVRAYPTTVFMDGQGNVTAVHTGFSGPATGARHQRLRERFEAEIDVLIGVR